MSGVTPTFIDFQGFILQDPTGDVKLTNTMDGVDKGFRLDFDLLTVPKYFSISPNGVYWSDGTNTYFTSLEDLALVQTVFAAVEPPPNSTTLQVNNTIYLTDGVSATSTLNTSSLTFNDGTYTPSVGVSGTDLVVDGQGARLLLNANDNEFYLGQFSASTAPCILSSGSSSMTLNINSRSGITNIGDCDNTFNKTKISVDDTSSLIVLDTTQLAVIGDNNGVSTNAKLNFDIANSEMNWVGNGIGQASFDTGLFKAGDLNSVGNSMKIVVDDANGVINIDNNGDTTINIGDIFGGGNGTKISVNDATTTFTIDFPTINFQNTATTTSSNTHNASIKSTSNGLESTTFLKVKLNGNDIWLPYFTTDPSL
jgi:hypothetical protein